MAFSSSFLPSDSGTSGLDLTKAAATDDAINLDVTGDTHDRFVVDADGTHTWGPGNAAGDIKQFRTSGAATKPLVIGPVSGSPSGPLLEVRAENTNVKIANSGGTNCGSIGRDAGSGGLTVTADTGKLMLTAGATANDVEITAANASGNVVKLLGNGGTVIGSTALATGATKGFVYLPSVAGTPTGTPTAQSATVPMVYDTAANKLWAYNGAWRSVTFS